MQQTPRTLAVRILDRVEKGAFAQPLLDVGLSRGILTSAQDQRLLTHLVYGTLRLRGRLDWIIRDVYTGSFDQMEPGIRNILRVALYQLMETDRVPAYAATNEAVEMTKRRYPGRSNLVNAVLRNAVRRMDTIRYPSFDDDPLSYISTFHSHPLWLVRLWSDEIGIEETRALCESDNEIPPLAVRVNRLKATTADIITEMEKSGCTVVPSRYATDGLILSDLPVPIGETTWCQEGMLQIQDEASQLISSLADPKPGEAVLDICAGEGIKTTHLAQMMQNTGRIVAMDISRKKVESSRELSRRLGAAIIEPVVHDATKPPSRDLWGRFDRVLVDVPCAGLGTVRRNPEIKWHTTPEDLGAFPTLQREILNRSAAYLKKGGIMVYSTCTIDSAENEKVVRKFLLDNSEFELVRPATVSAALVDEAGFFRTFPHRHGTDGFFGAVLRKKEDSI